MTKKSGATLGDVARLAQVSISTASKGLNGYGAMRPMTRRRIHDAARALHFTLPGREIPGAGRRTGTVGLLTDDLHGRFALPILEGAEDELSDELLSVLLCDSRGDASRERNHLRALLARGVDGLIVVGQTGNPRTPLPPTVPVPVVYALSPSTDPDDVSVTSDDVGAGRLATEHVLALGRPRVLYVGGDPSYVSAVRRMEGSAAALRLSGLEFVSPPVFGPWSEEWGAAAVRDHLNQGVVFDAVICGSDQIARGALDALATRGHRVPADVMVVGHDNREDIVAHSRLPVSSVDMNLPHLGSRAARLLSDAWYGRNPGGIEYAPTRLVVRATSG